MLHCPSLFASAIQTGIGLRAGIMSVFRPNARDRVARSSHRDSLGGAPNARAARILARSLRDQALHGRRPVPGLGRGGFEMRNHLSRIAGLVNRIVPSPPCPITFPEADRASVYFNDLLPIPYDEESARHHPRATSACSRRRYGRR